MQTPASRWTRSPKLNGGKPYNSDRIPSVLEADETLRPDVIAMHHAFGGLPSEDGQVRERGSNVGRLVPTDVDYDPITGMPRQGNIPVSVTAGFDD